MEETLDTWFKREILVHEPALVRHLVRIWPDRNEVYDLRQDIYVRVYAAALKSRPHAPKSFLFATARNLVADRFRRRRIVAIDAVGDLAALDVLVEEISPEQRASAHQELRRLAEAIDQLPPRCRETVWLRRVEDVPQKEVATMLGTTQKTVENQLRKGMQMLVEAFFGNEPHRNADSESSPVEDAREEHGKP
jgi:RNA polymerase sigma factor (sigma-70 family)